MDAPRTNLRRSRLLPWIVLLAAGGAVGGAYAVWASRRAPPPPPSATAEAVPSPAPAEPSGAAAPAEAQVDAAGARALLEGVTTSDLLRRWLGEADLVRRCVVVADNVAEGVSPRRSLRAFAPASPFSVARSGDGSAISPESYSRHDRVADAIASVDAQALATAYRRLHGVLESAYRMLGHPEGSLDGVVSRALARIEKAPVVEGDVRVELREGLWVFADDRLEALPDVEKHLLRMGPRNTRILQSKAGQLRAALRLPEQVAAGAR